MPLHSYALPFIAARLEANLRGVPDRDQTFYAEWDLIPDEPELQFSSWTDRLNDKPLRPSHRLFASWRAKWSQRPREWLLSLLLACIHAGCDLRDQFGESLVDLVRCPESMRPLAMAAGFIGLLRGQTIWACLPDAVRVAACCSSHKNARAAGRPPPQYGGALEFYPTPG